MIEKQQKRHSQPARSKVPGNDLPLLKNLETKQDYEEVRQKEEVA